MKRVHVDVVMANDLLDERAVRKAIRALEKQVTKHFAPVWDVTCDLEYVGHRKHANKGAWQLVLLDEASKDADGYHELTREGLPLGKVLLRTAQQCETTWTSTASHELLELLGNPDTQRGVFVGDKDGYRVYTLEVCDPCQDDPFCYEIDGVYVSDFVLPTWFETWRKPRSVPFDHAKKLRAPFEIGRGGYVMFYETHGHRWVDQSVPRKAPTLEPLAGYARTPRGGSRGSLRKVPRQEWRRSRC